MPATASRTDLFSNDADASGFEMSGPGAIPSRSLNESEVAKRLQATWRGTRVRRSTWFVDLGAARRMLEHETHLMMKYLRCYCPLCQDECF